MQKMVDLAVGIPRFTYQMNRNAPRPKGDYAAIKLVSTKKVGYDKVEYLDTPLGVMYKSTGVRILEFRILFSRDDIEADNFNNSFHRPDLKEFMWQNGYALMANYPLENRDKKFESDWEFRTGNTLIVSTVREHTHIYESIEAVEVDGEFIEGEDVYHIDKIKIKGETE